MNNDSEDTLYKSSTNHYDGITMSDRSSTQGGCYTDYVSGYYTSHVHTGSCSYVTVVSCAGGPWDNDGIGFEGCMSCGGPVGHAPITRKEYTCNGKPLNSGWVEGYYKCSCGYSNGELIGTELSFK